MIREYSMHPGVSSYSQNALQKGRECLFALFFSRYNPVEIATMLVSEIRAHQ
jgi:hypothetical protein